MIGLRKYFIVVTYPTFWLFLWTFGEKVDELSERHERLVLMTNVENDFLVNFGRKAVVSRVQFNEIFLIVNLRLLILR